MARPEAKIDLAELEKLAGMQCTNEEIGAFFGVSKRTVLRRCQSERFRDIIEQGRAKGRVTEATIGSGSSTKIVSRAKASHPQNDGSVAYRSNPFGYFLRFC